MGTGDKLYITQTEWSQEFGGAKAAKQSSINSLNTGFRRLPFDCCALSLQPFVQHPVVTPDGIVFDLMNIMPWLKQHPNTNPVTGQALRSQDLTRLHFARNKDGKLHCPISFKTFTESSHIVAVRTSGNVYAMDTVERLNIKPKYWKDLLTDEPFKRKDLIVIQDPTDLSRRNLNQFKHLLNSGSNNQAFKVDSVSDTGVVVANKLSSRIMTELAQTAIAPLDAKWTHSKHTQVPVTAQNAPRPENAAHFSTGRMAASFTSSVMEPVVYNEPVLIDENEYMYKFIKKKGFAQIRTSLGDVNLELHCDITPRTCHNFILLAQQGFYSNTKFHRNIPKFMIQGGDPTGTGRGGTSAFGVPFKDEYRTQLSHSTRGILSMANRGKDTNTSQFFMAYAACKHLDYKHTVFGKVVGGMDVLDKMEAVESDKKDRPLEEIKVLEVLVFTDPFEDWREEKARQKTDVGSDEKKTSAKRNLVDQQSKDVGKYMNTVCDDQHKEESVEPSRKVAKSAPRKTLNNFDNW